MKTYQLSRLQAIEVQRTFKDLILESEDVSPQEIFDRALKLVQNDQLVRVNRAEIEAAKFIIVFDLDETLYDQSLKPDNECANVNYSYAGKPKKIFTVKNIKAKIRKIKDLGGIVAIFSANSQNLTVQNLKNWKNEEGQDVYSMPEISAVLTGKELILQPKEAGQVIVSSSKDLRFFDEQLDKVIIVDDNPTRIFQHKNIRVVKKLDGDTYCQEETLRKAYNSIIDEVLTEIEDSVKYMEQNKVNFVTAYSPYSMMGKLAVDLLVSAEGISKAEAIKKVRENQHFVEPRF